MAKRRYRVTIQLPWIEGGRPAPGFGLEGGQAVVYEPGDTVEVDDRELAGIYNSLEPIDEAGRLALEATRAEQERPARRTAVADLHPRAVEWLGRSLDEKLRAQGNLRELCLKLIARDEDPALEDLAAALEAPEPPPRELLEYVAKILRGGLRKTGRKTPPRTTNEDLFIQSVYRWHVQRLEERAARNRQVRAPVKRRAAEEVAQIFGLSVRTVQRIVAKRPWTKSRGD